MEIVPCSQPRFVFELYVTPSGYREKIMEHHTQGGALAYLGLNYSALSGRNTIILKHFTTILKHFRKLESCN